MPVRPDNDGGEQTRAEFEHERPDPNSKLIAELVDSSLPAQMAPQTMNRAAPAPTGTSLFITPAMIDADLPEAGQHLAQIADAALVRASNGRNYLKLTLNFEGGKWIEDWLAINDRARVSDLRSFHKICGAAGIDLTMVAVEDEITGRLIGLAVRVVVGRSVRDGFPEAHIRSYSLSSG